jgi:hydroxymethylbilane synthase
VKKLVSIGTRRSRLAQVQSQWVLDALQKLYPETTFGLTTIVTTGDKNKTTPIEKLPIWGAFVKEIQDSLLNHKIDIAVHSLKDLPVEELSGLRIAAITQRIDPRDVLISRSGDLDSLPSGSLIGTGSPRRTAELLAYRPDLKAAKIRGNVDTRLKKLENGEFDAIIIAAAGLLRLGWKNKITQYLPLEHFLPEAGQAAMAVEVRADDQEMMEMIKPLNDNLTSLCVRAERSLLKEMGGGCSIALGTLATIEKDTLTLRSMFPGREHLLYAAEEGNALNPEGIARKLAQKLLNMGAIRAEQEKP